MLRNCFLLLCIFGLALFVESRRLSSPRVTCNGNVCIKNHGRSGKFSVSRGNKTENATNTITIEFDAIKEVNKDGNEVGKTGPRAGRHSFNSFAPLDFDFTDVVNTTYKGIKAKAFNFSAKIEGPNATLNVPIFFFSDNGTVDLCNDEEIDTKRGIMKYNIELFNWDFCKVGSGCTKGNREEIGMFVDFKITVRNRGRAVVGRKETKQPGKRRKARKFFFGNSSISFPSAIQADRNCTDMPEEYPKLEVKRNMYSVTFRFPRFKNKIVYDPSVNVIESTPPPTTPPGDSTPPPSDSTPPPSDSTPPASTTKAGCSKRLPSVAAVLILGAFLCLIFK